MNKESYFFFFILFSSILIAISSMGTPGSGRFRVFPVFTPYALAISADIYATAIIISLNSLPQTMQSSVKSAEVTRIF
jgi:hypothetical protein